MLFLHFINHEKNPWHLNFHQDDSWFVGFVKKPPVPKELMAEPHTMLLMLNSRWEYAYTPNGEALALQTFMLTEPAIYCLEVRGKLVGLSWGNGGGIDHKLRMLQQHFVSSFTG